MLVPFISNGPLISWMYPVFGMRGASWFLGAVESLTFLLAGFWNRKAGLLGALLSVATFVGTVTIILMVGNVPLPDEDVVLLAASIHLLKEDVERRRLVPSPETGVVAAIPDRQTCLSIR